MTVMNACAASDPRNNQYFESELLDVTISTISDRKEL